MTRYESITWARRVAEATTSGAIFPSGAWELPEVNAGIRAALGAGNIGLTDSEIDALLGVAYSWGSADGQQGQFVNVANQHVTSWYTLPRDSDFGYGVNYDGYAAGQGQNLHVFTANSPTDTHIRLGIMIIRAAGTDPPDTPSSAHVQPSVTPEGAWTASVWITIPAGETNLDVVLPAPPPADALFLRPIPDVEIKRGENLVEPLPSATGGVMPYAYMVSGAPPWATLDTASNSLTGTAETIGAWDVTWTVMDERGETASQTFRITVAEADAAALTLPMVPNITWLPGQGAVVQLPEASGGTPPYTYTLRAEDDEGAMQMPIPAWLGFEAATRRMASGNPPVSVTYLQYVVMDSSNPPLGAFRDFILTVVRPDADWTTPETSLGGVEVWHYGDSLDNNPTRIGFVLDAPPLTMDRGRTPESNEFITPTAEWTCHIPEDQIDLALRRYNIGDIVRVVNIEAGVTSFRHTGKIRAVSIDDIDGIPVVRGDSLGLTAAMRDSYPYQFDEWDTDVRGGVIAALNASGIRPTEYEVDADNLNDGLDWIGVRDGQGINVIQLLRFLTERTQGGNSHIDESREGLLRVHGNTAGAATPIAYVIPITADVRIRKRVGDEVVGVSYQTWEWTPLPSGTIFYDYRIPDDVPLDDIRRLYRIPRPSPTGPYQQLPFRFEIELPEYLYVRQISSATTYPLTNISTAQVIRSRWDRILIYGVGAPPGELTRIILRGSGAIARPRETKYYPASVGFPGPRPRDFGVIEPLGNHPTVSETNALAAAIALYERRQQGNQVFDVLIDPADDGALALDAGSRVSFAWQGGQRIGYVRSISERRSGLRWQLRLVVDQER